MGISLFIVAHFFSNIFMFFHSFFQFSTCFTCILISSITTFYFRNYVLPKFLLYPLDTSAKDNFNISQKHKEAHIQSETLNFSQAEIPKDYYDFLSKGLDYKFEKKRLTLLDILSGVKDATEKISATYIKNSF